MRFWRDKISPSVLLVILLAVLLGVLATLQYRWLSEISSAERDRLHSRLQVDARRFSQDFNAEITRVFYTFQIDSQILQPKNFELFAERYEQWRSQANFPKIVETIFLISGDSTEYQTLRQFNSNTKQFEDVNWTDETTSLRDKIRETAEQKEAEISLPIKMFSQAINEDIPALIIPVVESLPESMSVPSISNQSKKRIYAVDVSSARPIAPRQFIIVKLSAEAIKKEVLPEIFRRNFAEEESAYNFSVVSHTNPNTIVFQSALWNADAAKPDVSQSIFEISSDNSNILILDGGLPRVRFPEKRTVIFHQSIERHTINGKSGGKEQTNDSNLPRSQNSKNVQVRVLSNKSENATLELRNVSEDSGRWILNVQHADGSLENFVGKIKWRNLGLSFGILTLLGSSVLLLVFSTHKLRRTAQQQIDFVSSVSHEFRTPVAVICSAGDNLADGIITNPQNIEKYGRLIRREGNRLTEMVEQILEFAGARSGRKKYSFQKVDISPLVKAALSDCQSLLDEKGFTVETKIASDLPKIEVDTKAFRLVLQNLIINAIKFSSGSRLVEISAWRTGENIALSIKDQGIGIEAGEIKHIFEPFFRGKSVVDAQIHGNGLGLSLVKQIIDAHKGRISVESKPHKGSKFTIQIPI